MSRFVRTYKARKIFLDCLGVGDSVSAAARAAGGDPKNFRAWRKADPDFAQDWDDAIEEGTDFIEDVATERALTKSDPLMMMMLKARRPDKYDRGSKLELSGGFSVEGAKSKLLNKIARLQSPRTLSPPGGPGEQPILTDAEPEAQDAKLLPSPDPSGTGPIRGRKRRAAAGRGSGAAAPQSPS